MSSKCHIPVLGVHRAQIRFTQYTENGWKYPDIGNSNIVKVNWTSTPPDILVLVDMSDI